MATCAQICSKRKQRKELKLSWVSLRTKKENSQTRKKRKNETEHSQTSIVSVQLFFFFSLPATCGGGAMVEEIERETEREGELDIKHFWI